MKNYLAHQSNAAPAAAVPAAAADPLAASYSAILRGDAAAAVKAVKAALAANTAAPKTILDDHLLKAIAEVGSKFEKKEYFLPQLLAGAEALQAAITELSPALQSNDAADAQKEKFILATVKGDIHDIGKNIVALMLSNSGFEVIDLGKDVPAEVIVKKALELDCRLIGLSALMTTTMSEMPKVINEARRANWQGSFIVGGAVVDANFADSIGAAYAADAMGAVRAAQDLLKKF